MKKYVILCLFVLKKFGATLFVCYISSIKFSLYSSHPSFFSSMNKYIFIVFDLLKYFFAKTGRCFLVSAFVLCLGESAMAQMDSLLGYLYNQDSLQIRLYIRKPANTCGDNARAWFYKITINDTKRLKKTPYLSWKILTENCEGYRINRAFSISMKEYPFSNDTPKEDKDWNFMAKQLLGGISDARLDSVEHIEKDVNLGLELQIKAAKRDPTPIELPAADTVIQVTHSAGKKWIALMVTSPPLPKDANWYWFLDSCATSKPEAIGNRMEFSPQRDLTVYVRSHLGGRFSACYPVSIKYQMTSHTFSILGTESDLTSTPHTTSKQFPSSWSFSTSVVSFENFSKTIRPILAFKEFQLSEQPTVSAGYYVGIAIYRNKDVARDYSLTFTSIGVRSSLHSLNTRSIYGMPLRFYIGVSTGLTFKISGWQGNTLQEPEYQTHKGFNFSPHIGLTCGITPKYDIFTEVSGIVAPITIGLKIKGF